MQNFKNKFFNIIKFDYIVAQKLLQKIQYYILTIIFASLLAIVFDDFMGKYNKQQERGWYLFFNVFIQSIFIIIVSYYIPKFIKLIPFIFKFTDKYIVDFKNESERPIAIALSFAFIGLQKNYKNRIETLFRKIYNLPIRVRSLNT